MIRSLLFGCLLMANVVSAAEGERVWIRVAADGWSARLAEAPDGLPEEGQSVWTWSDRCPPMRQTSGATECGETERIDVLVTTPGVRRPLSDLDVRWGTAAMLAVLPDALLPAARTDAGGRATLRVPKGEIVFARVAGGALASGWIRAASPRVTLAATEAVPVAVQVTLGGEAAAFARLELRTTDAPQPNGLVFRGIGERGSVELPPIPAGAFLSAMAWSDGGAPAIVSSVASRMPRAIAVPPGVGIRGVIVDEEDKAISGAAVSGLMMVARERIPIRKVARSGADGTFAMRGFAPGDVEWIVSHDTCAPLARVLRLTEDVDAGRVILEKSRVVRVQVTDVDGKAIARASLATPSGIETTTDDSGGAVLRRVPARGFNLRLSARGYLPRETRIEPDARQPLRVALRRAASVRLRVVHATDGTPAGPGSVVRDLDGGTTVIEFGPSGDIEIDGLEAGNLSLDIRAEGLAPFRIPGRELAAGEHVDLGAIRLERGFSISGRMVAEGTLVPIGGASVRVLRPTAGGPILAFLRQERISTTTTADGSFSVPGLVPGVYSLWTESPGHAPLVRTGITVNDEVPNADIALGDLAVPSAHTLAITCEPVARCGNEAALVIAGADWFPIAAPVTAGEATLQPVPAGSARLRLRDRSGVLYERDVAISADDDVTTVAVRLRSVRVSGVIMRGGNPVEGGTVTFTANTPQDRVVQIAYRRGAGTIGNEMVGNLRRNASAPVDTGGAFTLSDLGPADYNVTWSSAFGTSSVGRTITIPDADEVPLRLDLPAATLTGTIRATDGSVPEQCSVTAETSGGTVQMFAGSDGTFTISGLAGGRVLIRASSGRAMRAQKTVEIEEGRPSHIDLTLEPSSDDPLTIVVASGGMPVANAFVFLRENGSLRAATTGSNGRATFRVNDANASFEIALLSGADGWTFAGPRRASGGEIAIETPRARAALSIRSPNGAAPVAIFAAGGFPIHEALTLLGSRPVVHPGAPLVLPRLPAGTYTVTAGMNTKSVTLADGPRELTF